MWCSAARDRRARAVHGARALPVLARCGGGPGRAQAELGIHPRGRWPRYRPQGAREVLGSRRPRADGRRRTHMARRMTVTPQICAASTVGFARCGFGADDIAQTLRACVMPLFAEDPLRVPD